MPCTTLGVLLEDFDLDEAEALFLESIRLRTQLNPDHWKLPTSHAALAGVAFRRGDMVIAEEQYRLGLEIANRVWPDGSGGMAALQGLGMTAYERGDCESARQYLELAVQFEEEYGHTGGLVGALQNLASLESTCGNDPVAAEQHLNRALDLLPFGDASSARASLLRTLSETLQVLGRTEEARSNLLQAQEIVDQLQPGTYSELLSLETLGEFYKREGNHEEATEHFASALELADRASFDSHRSRLLYELAQASLRRGNAEEAALLLDRSLAALEEQGQRLAADHETQAEFLNDHRRSYRLAVQTLRNLGRDADAFHVLERYRARVFLEQMTERDLVMADLPPELDRRRRAHTRRYDDLQRQLREVGPDDRSARLAELREKRRRLRVEAREIEASIRRASPRLATLRYPEPLTAREVEKALDPGTLLLSYSLGDEATDLFALSHGSSLVAVRLPLSRTDLEERVQFFLQLLRGPLQGFNEERSRKMSTALYDDLIRPVEELVAGAERLLIVADGPLHLLPFAALIRTSEEGPSRYLIETLPLHFALSATVYQELRASARPPGQARIAVFGDPDYPGTLPGLGEQVASQEPADVRLRSAYTRGILDWSPLPHARSEVLGIASLFGNDASDVFLGKDATETKVKKLGRKYDILHFATHGYYDPDFPLDSALVLSVPEDGSANGDNGLLQAWEIFESVRLDTDLVVLSACRTGTGKDLGGEGLISLTRAFQYAGARTVLASLWEVADQAASELMVSFYRHLLGGLPKDEALRAAQLELIRQPLEVAGADSRSTTRDVSNPFFWAAFQLHGGWR